MTQNILLNRLQGEKIIVPAYPKDPYSRLRGQAEEGRMTPTLPPFLRPSLLYSPTFCRSQTFAFVQIDLGSCYPLVLANRHFHSLYIQVAGYKYCDIIGECGNPCARKASRISRFDRSTRLSGDLTESIYRSGNIRTSTSHAVAFDFTDSLGTLFNLDLTTNPL